METATTTTPTTFTTTYHDALEDVHTRFILNLPESELQTADRIFFQLEQAWWFYEDWICDPHPEWTHLPRFANFKPFAQKLFDYSPLLPESSQFNTMWAQFSQYKRRISNYGCILMSADCSQLVLCRVWNGRSFSFPAGKINQGEDGPTAAARETYEETGFDPSCKFGLTATWRQTAPEKITWQPADGCMAEKDALVFTEDSGKRRTSYVVVGVPTDFPFEPVARKEVSAIEWFGIDEIPKQSYGVVPFLGPLKQWIRKYKNQQQQQISSSSKGRESSTKRRTRNGTPTDSRSSSRTSSLNRSRNRSRNGSRGRVIQANDDLVAVGLATAGEKSGWSEEEMFEVNEKLSGHRVEYDGNPHVFAEQGFAGGPDPHAFRVVGGSFLNANGVQSLAPPPDRSKLQPLFRPNNDDSAANSNKEELTPFFSNDGATPWGEVIDEARDVMPAPFLQKASPQTNSNKTKKKNKKPKKKQEHQPEKDTKVLQTTNDMKQGLVVSDFETLFLTDTEITARSQAIKITAIRMNWQELFEQQYKEDIAYCQQWVANLPEPRPAKLFGGKFKLDVDRIMAAVAPILNQPPTSSSNT